tara:strand:- start:834 stop:1040 length:207 start_codon:yes stop_codon:yes gene_type:complete
LVSVLSPLFYLLVAFVGSVRLFVGNFFNRDSILTNKFVGNFSYQQRKNKNKKNNLKSKKKKNPFKLKS